MNKDELNEFFTLLQGKCRHQPKIPIVKQGTLTCILCGVEHHMFATGHWQEQLITEHGELSYELRKWMEENMGEVWERYLFEMQDDVIDLIKNIQGLKDVAHSEILNIFLDPKNLFYFLNTNRELWGWVKCQNCHGTGKWTVSGRYPLKASYRCEKCNGTGKIKHPALDWLEEYDNHLTSSR
jgi:hypothetical protein